VSNLKDKQTQIFAERWPAGRPGRCRQPQSSTAHNPLLFM